MNKDISYPRHVLAGIGPNHRAYPLPKNLRVFGGDTETVRGRPHTIQVYDGKTPYLKYVTKETIFPAFWAYVYPRCRAGGVNLCYFHNLSFDLRVLFSSQHLQMYEQYNEVSFQIPIYASGPMKDKDDFVDVGMLYGKVNCATLKYGDVRLLILDSFAFTQTSLAKSLKMFQIPQGKLNAPEGLGAVPLRTKEFEAYAIQDTIAEYHLALKILEFHEKYKVRPSISLPQFVSRVFRHYFFNPDTYIKFPPLEVVKAAEKSYHGGKNGYYLDRPCVMEDVCELDINSAFPFAMRELPQFVVGRYLKVKAYKPEFVGIYCLSGHAREDMKYPLIFDHSFKPIRGPFEGLWTTCYEVQKILQSPEVKISDIWGYVWFPGEYEKNSFQEYVDHFYALKEKTPKSDPYYNFYKIALNGLYGKLVSVVEQRSVETAKADDVVNGFAVDYRYDAVEKKYIKVRREFKAGTMYNPFIASLITGRVRAILSDLELDHKALHSATDSIKTLSAVEKVDGLGGYKIEASGRCYFFRNKLYLHFSSDYSVCGHTTSTVSIKDKGQHLCKAAYHGFKANTRVSPDKVDVYGYTSREDLLFRSRNILLRRHHLRYSYDHVVGLREGLKRGETPCDFVPRTEILCLCIGEKTPGECEKLKCHCRERRAVSREEKK